MIRACRSSRWRSGQYPNTPHLEPETQKHKADVKKTSLKLQSVAPLIGFIRVSAKIIQSLKSKIKIRG